MTTGETASAELVRLLARTSRGPRREGIFALWLTVRVTQDLIATPPAKGTSNSTATLATAAGASSRAPRRCSSCSRSSELATMYTVIAVAQTTDRASPPNARCAPHAQAAVTAIASTNTKVVIRDSPRASLRARIEYPPNAVS